MIRIQKIRETYSEQFKERLEQESVSVSPETAWDILISADPSRNKKNVRWLVETYLNDGFLWEDIASGEASKASETLTEFDKHKRNLEVSERSLNKYLTLGSLWSAIKPYVGQMTSNEEKRDERDRAYAESEVVVDRDDGFKIIVPLTRYAAKWFGRGTRWCTAGDKDNMFEHYAVQAPLFIIIMPNGDKLQLWQNEHDMQFMDENDDYVTKEYIGEHWEYLKHLVPLFKMISLVPGKYLTPDLCEKAVQFDTSELKHIPKRFLTSDLCKFAVRDREQMFKYVPHEMKTLEFITEVIKYNSQMFSFISYEYRTPDFCRMIVEQDGMMLSALSNKMKTSELCEMAVKNSPKALQYVPEEFQNYEMCKSAVERDSSCFEHISNQFKTQEIVDIVLSDPVYLVRNKVTNRITYETCKEAVQKRGVLFTRIPDEYRTSEIYKLALSQNGLLLAIIPHAMRTEDVCQCAIRKNARAIASVPEILKTYEMCQYAVGLNPVALSYIPFEFREDIINNSPNVFSFIKEISMAKIAKVKEYYL